MKTILVRTDSVQVARKQAVELYHMLRDYTPVIAEIIPYKAEVRTESTQTRFLSKKQNIKGLRCDVPVNFGGYGKMMTRGKDFPELETLKDIAKFILDEEQER